MTLATTTLLLLLAVGLAWWVVRQTIAYRRDTASRETLVLEALFASRSAADGGASIDVDKIFGRAPTPDASPPATAALQAEMAAMLSKLHPESPGAARASATIPAGPAGEHIDAAMPPSAPAAVPGGASGVLAKSQAPVRDLVQVFFEARGFRPAPVAPTAQPIDVVLLHNSDEKRAYAFVPLAVPPSETAIRTIVQQARDLGHKRVLIAVEGALPDTSGELPTHGVRVLDREAIEAQLARLDAAVAERLRDRARQLASLRLADS